MAQCRWCDKRGLFLSVDRNGLCRDCQPMIIEIQGRARVLENSMKLAREGKTFDTRLSRCDLTIEHAEYLVKFERKEVPTVSPSPSAILTEYRALRTQFILEEANKIAENALEKASVASSPKVKERALTAGVLKLLEIARTLEDSSRVTLLEQQLRRKIHQVTLEGYLESARKAEFKGNVKKAIDQYQEALFFIQNDDVDDTEQYAEIREIKDKLKQLTGQ